MTGSPRKPPFYVRPAAIEDRLLGGSLVPMTPCGHKFRPHRFEGPQAFPSGRFVVSKELRSRIEVQTFPTGNGRHRFDLSLPVRRRPGPSRNRSIPAATRRDERNREADSHSHIRTDSSHRGNSKMTRSRHRPAHRPRNPRRVPTNRRRASRRPPATMPATAPARLRRAGRCNSRRGKHRRHRESSHNLLHDITSTMSVSTRTPNRPTGLKVPIYW